MTGGEILERLKAERKAEHKFIKWWRIENDFSDYELIDNFISRTNTDQEYAGYELLDMEDMWNVLKAHAPDRVNREERQHNDVIVWEHHTGKGDVKEEVCPFIPKSLMTIMDVETRGNPID
jgi:hypothetical protein